MSSATLRQERKEKAVLEEIERLASSCQYERNEDKFRLAECLVQLSRLLEVNANELHAEREAVRHQQDAAAAVSSELSEARLEVERLRQEVQALRSEGAARSDAAGASAAELRQSRLEVQKLQQEVAALRGELAARPAAHAATGNVPNGHAAPSSHAPAATLLPPTPPAPRTPAAPVALAWSPQCCGKKLRLTNDNRRAAKTGTDKTWTAAVLGTVPNPASYKVRVFLPDARHSAMIGLAPRRGFQPDDINHTKCGWYIHTGKGNLYAQDGVTNKSYLDYRIESGATVEVRYDRTAKQISFAVDGVCPGVAYRNLLVSADTELFPAVALFDEGAAAEFIVQ